MADAGKTAVVGEDRNRPVGAFALLALGVNGIVGVGIFFAPADLAAKAPGAASVLVLALTAVALAPVAFTFAALGRRFGESGGPVVYARAAFGELASFLVGWITYVSAIASAAAVSVGLTNAVLPLLGLEGRTATRVGATVLVTVLCLVVATGISISARVWTTLTILKLIPLGLLAGAYLLHGGPSARTWSTPGEVTWLPAALTATFTLQGFEIVPVIAGQVRSSSRAVPFATVASLAFAALLYLVLQSACLDALPALTSSTAPLAEAGGVWGGPWLANLVVAGTSVSALGITLGMMVTTPHYLAALARGGSMAFDLDRMTGRGVPGRSLAATWGLVVTLALQAETLGQLFALSAAAVLMQFVVTAAALAVLARRRAHGLGPAHVWLAVPSMVVGLAIASGATAREAVVAAVALVLGLLLRRLARRRVR